MLCKHTTVSSSTYLLERKDLLRIQTFYKSATSLNCCNKSEVVDGDAEGALAYLCAKAISDPLFYYKYGVNEENRLNNMF